MAYTHHISKAKLPWKFYKSVADLLGISRYFLMSGLYFFMINDMILLFCANHRAGVTRKSN